MSDNSHEYTHLCCALKIAGQIIEKINIDQVKDKDKDKDKEKDSSENSPRIQFDRQQMLFQHFVREPHLVSGLHSTGMPFNNSDKPKKQRRV